MSLVTSNSPLTNADTAGRDDAISIDASMGAHDQHVDICSGLKTVQVYRKQNAARDAAKPQPAATRRTADSPAHSATFPV